LSEILSNLSSVIRQRFKMRRKIRALAAEGKFSAFFLSGLPVAVFGFPSMAWLQAVAYLASRRRRERAMRSNAAAYCSLSAAGTIVAM